MIEINASLFAHIINAPFTSGVHGLDEGEELSRTLGYLSQYIDQLRQEGKTIPEAFVPVFNGFDYLKNRLNQLDEFSRTSARKENFGSYLEEITEDIAGMKAGDTLMLPGGYLNWGSGHAFICLFIRAEDGYTFKVVNGGEGLTFHSLKTLGDTNLYNPTKVWSFSEIKNDKEKRELLHFIRRLLSLRVPAERKSRSTIRISEVYNDVLPSIHHIGGKELNANDNFPLHAYTDLLQSNTCTQTCLYELLKIHSTSEEEYQRFLFDYKLSALKKYSQSCMEGKLPFTAGVVDQINLSINSLLDILNKHDLFSYGEIQDHYKNLIALKERLNQSAVSIPLKKEVPQPKEKQFGIYELTFLGMQEDNKKALNLPQSIPNPLEELKDSQLLQTLEHNLKLIDEINDPNIKYHYLKQLICSLPLSVNHPLDDKLYSMLATEEELLALQQHLNYLQTMLHKTRKTLIGEKQNPTINHLTISVLSLQSDTQARIAEKRKLPSFRSHTDLMMCCLVDGRTRDPFLATNDALLDARIKTLQKRFNKQEILSKNYYSRMDYYKYINELLDTEPKLSEELGTLYEEKYQKDGSDLHKNIKTLNLGKLFLILEHNSNNSYRMLPEKFLPLIKKIQEHLTNEEILRNAIEPLYRAQIITKIDSASSKLVFSKGVFNVQTPLPIETLFTCEQQGLWHDKYTIGEQSVLSMMLWEDTTTLPDWNNHKKPLTANAIQLRPRDDNNSDTSKITQAEIELRDYYHLRLDPELQIPLTLDYFTRQIHKLTERTHQQFVEANLFQPGLLANEIKDGAFLQKLDLFLNTGKSYFLSQGKPTQNSIFYYRLDVLVSCYYTQLDKKGGIARLKSICIDLKKQLSFKLEDSLNYALNQYLFLSLVTLIEQGEAPQEDLEQAFQSYQYLIGHTNPDAEEDLAQRLEMETAFARFKIQLNQLDHRLIETIIIKSLSINGQDIEDLKVDETFPNYSFKQNGKSLVINVLSGKIFEEELCRCGVPLAIQNHPLIIELGLNHIQTCLQNTDGTYLILEHKGTRFYLYYQNNTLVIQKDWIINGTSEKFELCGLSELHEAKKANPDTNSVVVPQLPQVLTDGTMNYWKRCDKKGEGILVRHAVPEYYFRENKITVLDAQASETPFQLTPLNNTVKKQLDRFENDEFIILQQNSESGEGLVICSRYDLRFKLDSKTQQLTHEATGEKVLDAVNPIHPNIAGLLLEAPGNKKQRLLVPIAKFYAEHENLIESEYIPVLHDTGNVIAKKYIHPDPNYRPQPLLWHHQNSQHYLSIDLKDGHPVPKNTHEALYLAYIYLANNETEKAWSMLEECKTRLGGIKGTSAELDLIYWICEEVPHTLAGVDHDSKKKLNKRSSSSYMACKLKAMSLLSIYVAQDRNFEERELPSTPQTANKFCAQRELMKKDRFLRGFPERIYQLLSAYQDQEMQSYVRHKYQLSFSERKSLLDHYYNTQNNGKNHPWGALGYSWMQLTLETIQEEYHNLTARKQVEKDFPKADQKRLTQIEQYISKLRPVLAASSKLELVSIDLNLETNPDKLPKAVYKYLNAWEKKLTEISVGKEKLDEALKQLHSNIADEIFITHFAAYLQIAASNQDELRKQLLDFCTSMLISKRHVKNEYVVSIIPFLCNILYRVAHNTEQFQHDRPENMKELIEKCSNYSVPELKVYQAENVFKDILIAPEKMLAEKKRPKKQKIHENLMEAGSFRAQLTLNEENKKSLEQLIDTYSTLLKGHREKLSNLAEQSAQSPEEAFSLERKAGDQRYSAEQEKNKFAISLLKDNRALLSAVQQSAQNYSNNANQLWKEALNLANQGPDDPKLNLPWQIGRTSGARKTLSKADLFSLYIQNDISNIIEQTGLSSEQAKQLHHLIHQALTQGIVYNTIQKAGNLLEKALGTNDSRTLVDALDLLEKKEIPGLDEPAIVLLQHQHEQKILLFDRQVNSLKSLLTTKSSGGYQDVIEKITMGGGKSKVITPILVERKAQGNNLVIVEVPQTLLATNHEDLNRTSQRLFQKNAHRFEFTRDSNCSPQRLKEIYEQFLQIMATKDYLVTTGEAMQSLELKYVELLLAEEPQSKEWSEQVYWCDKIINLIHNRGDCLIDEVHKGLSIKKKLNYTHGQATPIDSSLVDNTTFLFKLIDPQFIKDAPNLSKDFDWDKFKKTLATKLVEASMGPLSMLLIKANHDSSIKAQLINYLTNKCDEIPEIVLNASEEIKETLGFFKGEINEVLPHTLTRRFKEHYGPSQRSNLSPLEKTVSIPYAANNISKESNRFGVLLEAANYPGQMLQFTGISKELIIEKIEQWNTVARQEFIDNTKLKSIDDTPTAKGLNLLVKDLDLTLSQIDLKDEKQVDKLFSFFQHHSTLAHDLLHEKILKQIVQEPEIICSDSMNHVDMYRSAQGISGSAGIIPYHQRLQYNKTSSLGTDGYILRVIQEKKTRISNIDYKNVPQFVGAVLDASEHKMQTRAFIDLRAVFQGISNLHVAQEIAKYYSTQKNHEIKHILYYDEEQILCAIAVDKPDVPIVLNSTDEEVIYGILDTRPEQRFTYYDQAHAIGLDIVQADDAHAIVFADEKTPLEGGFLQGVMRMRRLAQKQSVELIVPNHLNNIKLPDLIENFATAEKNALLRDSLIATKLLMNNLLRRQALSITQEMPADDVVAKSQVMKQLRNLFVEKPTQSLFAIYGGISKSQETEIILKEYKIALMKQWNNCVQGVAQVSINASVLEQQLDEIINVARRYCLEKYEAISGIQGKEVEVHTEIQKEVAIELETLNEFYDPKLKELMQQNWPDNLEEVYAPNEDNQFVVSLNSICAFDPQKEHLLFYPQLKVSRNYAMVYEGQKKSLSGVLKPTFLVWYHLHENTLHATLITNQEYQDLKAKLKGQNLKNSWISTTMDTCVAGNCPTGIVKNQDYLHLREQVRFFNGEFESLINQEEPLGWLREQTQEKLDFFNHNLQTLRPGSSGGFSRLKSTLSKIDPEGFRYIAKNPFIDLSHFKWETILPKVVHANTLEYQKLAKTFTYMNENWDKEELDVNTLAERFSLPLVSLEYVNDHLACLKQIKEIWIILDNLQDNTLFLNKLSNNQHNALKLILDIPLDDINTRHVNSNEQAQLEKADFDVIAKLSSHKIFQFQKDRFGDKFINMMLKKASTSTQLMQIIEVEAFDKPKMLPTIISHHAMDTKGIEQIVNKLFSQSATGELIFTNILQAANEPAKQSYLTLLANKELNAIQIEDLLKHQLLDLNLAKKLVNKPEFKKRVGQWDWLSNEQLKNKEFVQLMMDKAQDKTDLLSILNRIENKGEMFKQIIDHSKMDSLGVAKIVGDYYPNLELKEQLVTAILQTKNNKDYLKILAKQDLNSEHIGRLLGHSLMDAEFAKELFAKPKFNKKIDNWNTIVYTY